MAQTTQFGHMAVGHAADITLGGMCAWRLPADARCASVGRSLLEMALTSLGLERDMVDSVVLAVSELTTNALNHGLRAAPSAPAVYPELWVWAKTTPVPQLVVSVFDTCRDSWPDTTPKDILDEHGKGIGIVGMVADSWGAYLSCSLCGGGTPGKVVWGAFSLPGPWPDPRTTAPPALVGRHLAATLTARGIPNVAHRQGRGVSLVSVPRHLGEEANVWVEPRFLGYAEPDGTCVRRPVVDLYDVAEDLVRQCEVDRARVGNGARGRTPGYC